MWYFSNISAIKVIWKHQSFYLSRLLFRSEAGSSIVSALKRKQERI